MQHLNPNSSQLHHFIDAGYELIPLNQHNAIGKNCKKVGKAPIGRDWQNKPALTLAEAEAHMATGGNIGVRLKYEELVVDVDPRNFEDDIDSFSGVLCEFPELDEIINTAPSVLTGSRTEDGQPGEHYYLRYRLPKDWGLRDRIRKGLKRFPGVEFKTMGTQLLAVGCIHPDTGLPYTWREWNDDDSGPVQSFADMPEIPESLFNALWFRPTPKDSLMEGAELDAEMLAEYLAQLDPVEFRDYDEWLKLMIACHAATLGDGIEEFAEWSTSDDQYAHCADEIMYKWDTFDADGEITSKTLNHLAEVKGINMPRRPERDFGDTADEDSKMEGDPARAKNDTSWLGELNEKYCTAMESGKFWVFARERDEALNRDVLVRIQPHHFKQNFATRQVQVGKKPVKLGDAWMEWGNRRSYDSVQFLPEHTPNEYTTPDGRKIYNLWTGYNVTAEPGDWSVLERLMREALTGSDTEYEYLVDWLAYSVQNPQLPAGVAIAFRGLKGTGKSTLGRIFCNLFGSHSLPIASRELLTGRFNLHLRDCVALFADEAFFAGDKDGEARLKGLITEPVLTFEGKNLNAIMGRNTLSVMMATNSDWVVPASTDERRFVVYNVDPIFKGDTNFFNALHKQMNNGGLEALLHDLLERDISAFHPERDAPKTTALAEQVLESITDAHQFAIYQMILTGLPQEDITEYRVEIDGSLVISKRALEWFAESLIKKNKGLHLSRSTSAAKKVLEKLLEGNPYNYKLKTIQPRLTDDGQIRSWQIPHLLVMREQLAKTLHCSIGELSIESDVETWADRKALDEAVDDIA